MLCLSPRQFPAIRTALSVPLQSAAALNALLKTFHSPVRYSSYVLLGHVLCFYGLDCCVGLLSL